MKYSYHAVFIDGFVLYIPAFCQKICQWAYYKREGVTDMNVLCFLFAGKCDTDISNILNIFNVGLLNQDDGSSLFCIILMLDILVLIKKMPLLTFKSSIVALNKALNKTIF